MARIDPVHPGLELCFLRLIQNPLSVLNGHIPPPRNLESFIEYYSASGSQLCWRGQTSVKPGNLDSHGGHE